MALTDSDLEGFGLVAERKPEKSGGVTVTSIPAMLVKLLEQEAPKALADAAYELNLSVPVRPDYTDVPKIHDKSTQAEKDAALKAQTHADDEALKHAIGVVKQLALYAGAWGKGQEPKLYIHKIPNRKDMSANVARLAVEKWDDVPKENRPGRR